MTEQEKRWTIARSRTEQYPDAILRDEDTNRRAWYEARPDMFELVVVVPLSRALAAEDRAERLEGLYDRAQPQHRWGWPPGWTTPGSN